MPLLARPAHSVALLALLLAACGRSVEVVDADGVPVPSCTSDTDCPPFNTCVADVGVCAVNCQTQVDCSGSQTCDKALGVCIDRGTCFTDAECHSGQTCTNGRCSG